MRLHLSRFINVHHNSAFFAKQPALCIVSTHTNVEGVVVYSVGVVTYLEHLHGHLCRRRTGSRGGHCDRDSRGGVRGPELGHGGLLLGLSPLLLLCLLPHQLLPQQYAGRHGSRRGGHLLKAEDSLGDGVSQTSS